MKVEIWMMMKLTVIYYQNNLADDDFYAKLKTEEYKERAYYEFALCKQLQVDSYPQVLLQLSESKFYLVAKGYTAYEDVKK